MSDLSFVVIVPVEYQSLRAIDTKITDNTILRELSANFQIVTKNSKKKDICCQNAQSKSMLEMLDLIFRKFRLHYYIYVYEIIFA